MVLQKLVGKIYSVVMEILMWIIPIAGFVVLGILMAKRGSDFHFGYALLGLVAGLILDVTIFAPVIIILNMRSSLIDIDENLYIIGTNLSGTENSSGINIAGVSPITPTINEADSWICKKCSERNANSSTSCKGCGAYK